jgi:tetratricopeptide (TPR) repeat protein
MRRAWLALLVAVVACKSAPLKDADMAALAVADARVLDGCYDCLIEAHDTYARLAVGKARPLVVTRLFETELLLTLREKELALDSSASFGRAQALVAELAPMIPAARYVADVADVLPDDLGTPVKARAAAETAHRDRMAGMFEEVTWLANGPLTAPVGKYLSFALDCSYPFRGRAGVPLPSAPADAPPLVRYRAAICRLPDEDVLKAVRAQVPRFIETAYFLARVSVTNAKNQGPGESRPLLHDAYVRFPKSPSVTYLDANFNQLLGDCRAALGRFDETLVLQPTHENALLGRTQCLAYLGRYDESVTAATRMIELRALPGDAYFWRAWDWRELKDLEKARADIEVGKSLGFTEAVYRLAGMIEHDQDDLDPAEKDLLAAIKSSAGMTDCTAKWYLGLVYMKKTRWTDAGGAFKDASGCYYTYTTIDQAKLNAMKARTNLDPDFQASQIVGFEAALKEDLGQYYAGAFNAAANYAHGGDLATARPLLEVAAQDPALADVVQKLRDIIK